MRFRQIRPLGLGKRKRSAGTKDGRSVRLPILSSCSALFLSAKPQETLENGSSKRRLGDRQRRTMAQSVAPANSSSPPFQFFGASLSGMASLFVGVKATGSYEDRNDEMECITKLRRMIPNATTRSAVNDDKLAGRIDLGHLSHSTHPDGETSNLMNCC